MQKSIFAFSGSRHLSANSSALAAASALLAGLPAGVTVSTGCCPSGLDCHVRAYCSQQNKPLQIFKAANQTPQALRTRTAALVSAASALFVFPLNTCPISSGSWLAVWSAVRSGVPVFVHLTGVPVASFPCLVGVSSWQASSVPFAPSVPLFVPLIRQSSLFNPVQPVTSEHRHK